MAAPSEWVARRDAVIFPKTHTKSAPITVAASGTACGTKCTNCSQTIVGSEADWLPSRGALIVRGLLYPVDCLI